MIQPDYTRIERVLAHEHSLADAAEAHGTLAGCLCGASGYRFEDWLKEILPEGRATAAVAQPLRELYDATASALIQPDMQFELLLPEDERAARAAHRSTCAVVPGVSLWSGRRRALPMRANCPGRSVRSCATSSRSRRADAQVGDEANENAYAELVEFVRVGVQLLFEELAVARAPAAPTAAPLH